MEALFELIVCGGIMAVLAAIVVFCFLIGWHMKNHSNHSGKKGFNHE